MARERRDEFVVEVSAESTFATSEGGGGDPLAVWDLSGTGVDYEVIENPAYTLDIATHEPIKGVVYTQAAQSFSSHAVGQVTAKGNGSIATSNAVTKLIGGLCGAAPTLSTGDTVASAASSSVFTQTTAGRHGVNQLVAVGLSTGIEVRPCTGYSTDTLTLGIKLSATPQAADVIYGAATGKWDDNPSSHYYVQTRMLGADTSLNKELLGQVCNLSIGEVGPNEIPVLSWELKAADFTDIFSDSAVAATAYRGTVNAGGQFIIAAAGSAQDYMRICTGRVSINVNADYDPVECAHDTAIGISGWRRMKGIPEITIVLDHDNDPNVAATASGSGGLGLTATSWRQVWRDGTENAFQILAQYGTSAGSIFAWWVRSCYLVKWEEITLGGIAYQKLTFRPKTGATAPPWLFGQA